MDTKNNEDSAPETPVTDGGRVPEPTEPERPKNKRLWWALLVVSAVVLASVGGCLAWRAQHKSGDNKSQPAPSKPSSQKSPDSGNQDPPPPDNNDGWKTHTNAQAGYRIDYNGQWLLAPRAFSNCGANCTYVEDLLIKNQQNVTFPGGGGLDNGSLFGVRIFAMSAPANLTIRSWIQSGDIPEAQKQARSARVQNMYVAGADREVLVTDTENWQKEIDFVAGNKVYQLSYMSASPAQFTADQVTFRRMLDSFALLN